MRVVVTGAGGFVGRHLCEHLAVAGDEVFALRRPGPDGALAFDALDVRDRAAVHRAFERTRPEAVVHLAGVSSAARSHAEPELTFEINALGALHVCMAMREVAPKARLLLVASGEVYGAMEAGGRANESDPLVPTSPYAAAKVAAEAIGLQFARSYGLRIVSARPFNHIGSGQASGFVVPSFTRQLDLARRGLGPATIAVGNLEPVRDFSHVRDVVAAYRILLERGIPGEAYNVCSGEGRSIRSILDELADLAGVAVDVRVDPSRFRPNDIPYLVGDATKLRSLGWVARHGTREALRDVLAEIDTGHH